MLIYHLRVDSGKGLVPSGKVMFETSAEAIEGLAKAFRDYEAGEEKAWSK